MKFTTPVKIIPSANHINHSHDLVSMGSCFADNIGRQLLKDGFRVAVNDLGILFNPTSIQQVIMDALTNNRDENLVVERNKMFYHYGYHAKLYAATKRDLLAKLDEGLKQLKTNLENADYLILTFGTAWVYELIEQDKIVANCHKIKQDSFRKKLLNLTELKSAYTTVFDKLKALNPKLEIILTVSPVRHTKNGLHENNSSKAILHLLTDYLCETYSFVNYFPAYELVIDELRDYRFYKEDMIHPTDQAVEYVYKKFSDIYFEEATVLKVAKIAKLAKAEKHIHYTEDNVEAEKLAQKIRDLKG